MPFWGKVVFFRNTWMRAMRSLLFFGRCAAFGTINMGKMAIMLIHY